MPCACPCCSSQTRCGCCERLPNSITVTFSNITYNPGALGCLYEPYLLGASGDWLPTQSYNYLYQKPISECYSFQQNLSEIQIPCNGLLRTTGAFVFAHSGLCDGRSGLNVGVRFTVAHPVNLCATEPISPVNFNGFWQVGGVTGCNGFVDVALTFNYPNPLP